MKGCGVAWKNLSEVKKAEYKSKHEKSKEPYLKELNKWESAIDKDGRKQTLDDLKAEFSKVKKAETDYKINGWFN